MHSRELVPLAAPGDPQDGGGGQSVDGLLTSLTGQISVIAFAFAALMCVILGIKVMASIKGGSSLREAVSNLGVIGVGVAIVAGGAAILGAVTQFVTSVNG